MRNSIALTIAAAGVLAFAGCGDDGNDDNMPSEHTGGMVTSVESGVDQAKLTAFVASFRTGYSELAEGRSDEDIEKIVTKSCDQLATGASKEAVTVQIETLAANGDTKPTPEQAENIYNLVSPACP
ncbi:hypothetical protein ACWDUM_20975 [Rhodococcus sp. NPDC003322]